jgi:glutamine synthetase
MTKYQRIRVLWPDHLGLARGKYLPDGHAANGTGHCLSTFALTYDKDIIPSPGTKVLEGLPDMRAVFDLDEVRPGWEDGTGVVVADLVHDGGPLDISPRTVLQRAVEAWQELGYEPQIGLEFEVYLLEPDGNGGWRPWDTPGGFVYGTGRAVDPLGVLDEITTRAERCGLPIESINSEFDIPQYELTLHFDRALAAVDDAFLFKVLAREVAQEYGLLCTFLGKPLADRSGSGLHVNLSLIDADGRNLFDDPSAEDGLSQLTHQCIAGMLSHHEGMTALLAPTVNAYKRLMPGQLAGYWANWGYDHRGVTVRVSAERGPMTRVEHRLADGAANPYTAVAALLHAARLGVVHEMEAIPAETGDCFETANTDRRAPANLAAALEALEGDKELTAALGKQFVEHFCTIKQAEWASFATAVTDWELKHYLPFH